MIRFEYAPVVDYAVGLCNYEGLRSAEIRDHITQNWPDVPKHLAKFGSNITRADLSRILGAIELKRTLVGSSVQWPDCLVSLVPRLEMIAKFLDEDGRMWSVPEMLWPGLKSRVQVNWFVSYLLPTVLETSGRIGTIVRMEDTPEIRLMFGMPREEQFPPKFVEETRDVLIRGLWYYLIKLMVREWAASKPERRLSDYMEMTIRACIHLGFAEEAGMPFNGTEVLRERKAYMGLHLFQLLKSCKWERWFEIIQLWIDGMGAASYAIPYSECVL